MNVERSPDFLPPEAVVWVPPETKRAVLGQNAVDPSPHIGEFREIRGTDVVEGREVPIWGNPVQWVDEAPEDPTNGTGHFERYSGSAENYTPHRSVKDGVEEAPEEPSE